MPMGKGHKCSEKCHFLMKYESRGSASNPWSNWLLNKSDLHLTNQAVTQCLALDMHQIVQGKTPIMWHGSITSWKCSHNSSTPAQTFLPQHFVPESEIWEGEHFLEMQDKGTGPIAPPPLLVRISSVLYVVGKMQTGRQAHWASVSGSTDGTVQGCVRPIAI